jgi:antitoxin component of MazEF toxin-antitoxin module
MVIPRSLREEAGVSEGTLMKVSVVEGRRFLLTPQFTLDRAVVEDPGKSRKQVFRELSQIVAEIRQEAKEKGLDKMSKREINAAVAAARRDSKKTSKQPAK